MSLPYFLVHLISLDFLGAHVGSSQILVRGPGLRLAGSSVQRLVNGLRPSPLAGLDPWSSLLEAEESAINAPAFHGSRHVGGIKTRIFIHHIWKCGGMNLCDMALRNGELTPHPDFANRYAGCDLWTVEQLYALNYSFAQWQNPLPMQLNIGGLPSEIATLTILRNPLNQALSHFNHVQMVLPGAWSNLSSFVEFGICYGGANRTLGPQAAFDQCQRFLLRPLTWSSLSSDPSLFCLFEDNQQLRWTTPVWLDAVTTNWPQLNAKYVNVAKERLEKFDQVLILEQMHNRDRFRLAKYGWKDLDDERGANLHSDKQSWQPSDAGLHLKNSPAALKRLCQVQQWDIALYDEAIRIAERQAAREGIKTKYLKRQGNAAKTLCRSL